MPLRKIALRWDEEYQRGRYQDEPPDSFVQDIIEAVRHHRPPDDRGLYIGCGNGRNYVPLVQAGLDLVGLDVSQRAIEQLTKRMPYRAANLVHGDLAALPHGSRFGTVIGIQLFQHGTEAETHANVRAAIDLIVPGGLVCLRVNAAGTQLEYAHTLLEENAAGGLTIRYEEGPKCGLSIHFFARDEIERLTNGLVPVVPLRVDRTYREAPAAGHWEQWEGIWQVPA